MTHLFGTGFPKSHCVSKALDKAAGAERPDLGPSPFANKGRTPTHNGMSGAGTDSSKERITIPSTAAAKQWQGFGTSLKPAAEFWWLVRKPCSEKTVAANVIRWGCGAINVDGCRIPGVIPQVPQPQFNSPTGTIYGMKTGVGRNGEISRADGRFPANLVLDEEAAAALDEQSGESGGGKLKLNSESGRSAISTRAHNERQPNLTDSVCSYGDKGGASRFFYTAKASKSDRGEGNTHPTVKSTKLMSYLCRLITPPNGTVLDPFMGSGSTGVAALAEGFKFIGIEQDAQYFSICESRINV